MTRGIEHGRRRGTRAARAAQRGSVCLGVLGGGHASPCRQGQTHEAQHALLRALGFVEEVLGTDGEAAVSKRADPIADERLVQSTDDLIAVEEDLHVYIRTRAMEREPRWQQGEATREEG